MRIFRLRSLAGANVTSFLVGTALFSQFFLGTLYMQQVLHYSALKTGVAYLPLTLTIIVLAGVAQSLVTRVGVRRVLPVGLALAAGALVLLAQLPADGHYFWDVFPAFVISAIGLAFTFIPLTIAALMGVQESDAGVASGLLNTTQQIGGAIGLAAASTIATTFTGHYVDEPPGHLAAQRAGAHLRLPDHLLRARRRGRARRGAGGGADRAEGRRGRGGRARADPGPGGRVMPSHEMEAVLLQIRTVALELRTARGRRARLARPDAATAPARGPEVAAGRTGQPRPGPRRCLTAATARDASSLPGLAADGRRKGPAERGPSTFRAWFRPTAGRRRTSRR